MNSTAYLLPVKHQRRVQEIAHRLGRPPSTLGRELRRDLRPHDRGIYDGDLATRAPAVVSGARRPLRGYRRRVISEPPLNPVWDTATALMFGRFAVAP
jgi:IS30 family transposase